jgi:hypothetical protein
MKLEWKRMGRSKRAWVAQPHLLDGRSSSYLTLTYRPKLKRAKWKVTFYAMGTLMKPAAETFYTRAEAQAWAATLVNRTPEGQRNPVFEIGVDDPADGLDQLSAAQIKGEIAYLESKVLSVASFGGAMMSQNVWQPRLARARELLKRGGATGNPDARRYWTADRIRLEYDRNPDLTLKQLSLMTGRTVAHLKRILLASK